MSGPIELFAQGAGLILGLHHSAFLENRHDPVNKVLKRARRHGVGEVEPIHSSLGPSLKFVRDLFRRPDRHGTTSADTDRLGEITYGPFAIRVCPGERIPECPNRICFDVFERFIRIKLSKVVPSPATQ